MGSKLALSRSIMCFLVAETSFYWLNVFVHFQLGVKYQFEIRKKRFKMKIFRI